MKRLILVILGSLCFTMLAKSQQQPMPASPPPMFYIKFQGEPGSSVSFLDAPGHFASYPTPVTVGLKLGYRYIFKVEGLQGPSGPTIYPTIEVRDVLRLPDKLKVSDHPAPVTFSKSDVTAAYAGSMLTKFVVLEDTEGPWVGLGSVNGAEVPTNNCQNTLCFANEVGRVMAIVRLGNREPMPDELQTLPPQPPIVMNCNTPPLPMQPYRFGQECIRDGGDLNGPVYRDTTGRLKGLDASDTVAEFTDSSGSKRIVPSNIVCLCVPRFVIIREATSINIVDEHRASNAANGVQEGIHLRSKSLAKPARAVTDPDLLRVRSNVAIDTGLDQMVKINHHSMLQAVDIPLGPFAKIGTDQMILLDKETRARMKRQADLGIQLSSRQKASEYKNKEGTRIIGVCDGIGQVTGSLETRTHTYFCEDSPPIPEGPLQILKWCSTDKAQIGDIVTFTIRYTNSGGKPIKDIAVTDSLSNRLEYIPGSAKSSREAVFVTEPNDAHSETLRWEIKQPLPGNQSGTVTFQARIR